jgi:hypothetical protein
MKILLDSKNPDVFNVGNPTPEVSMIELTEIIKKVIKNSFDKYPFFKVCSNTYSNNLSTIFAMRKFGFIKEGHRKYHRVFQDTRVDLLEYSLFLEYGEVVEK